MPEQLRKHTFWHFSNRAQKNLLILKTANLRRKKSENRLEMWEEYGIFMQYSLDQSHDSITNNHFGTVSCEYLIDLISFIKVQRLETPVSRGMSVQRNYCRPKHEEYYSITWAILSRIAEFVLRSAPENCYIKRDCLLTCTKQKCNLCIPFPHI